MAEPTNPILIIATDSLGIDGYTNKEIPDAPVLTSGYGKQSLPYQQLNYMHNNQGEWLKYIVDELIPQTLLARDEARYPIGSTLLTMTATNPSVGGWPGTWELLYTADSDIKLGDGSAQSGVASGDNSPSVPLLQHTHSTPNHIHTASFSGNALPTHTHTTSVPSDGTPDASTDISSTSPSGSFKPVTSSAVSAGTPSGSVTVNSGGASTTGATGAATPTLDVRGKGVAINVWERTA